MKRRAIIVVPGMQRREQNEVRDRLIESFRYNVQHRTVVEVDQAPGDDPDAVILTSRDNRTDTTDLRIGVYEAFWTDLVPEWSGEAIWTKARRATMLLLYWGMGGLFIALKRGQLPKRLTLMLLAGSALLVLWYLSILAVLLQTVNETGLPLPNWLVAGSAENTGGAGAAAAQGQSGLIDLIPGARQALDAIATAAAWLVDNPIYYLLAGLAGVAWLERLANGAEFVKTYLQTYATDDEVVGLRAKARQRLVQVLEHVRAADAPYDEVFVVSHSFGTVIAVDALAERTDPNYTLFTWGSPLGLLGLQETWIEKEVRAIYEAKPTLAGWTDVAFTRDLLATSVADPAHPSKRRWFILPALIENPFGPTQRPTLPQGISMFSRQMHNAYFSAQEVIEPLVTPAKTVADPDATPEPEKTSAPQTPEQPAG